MNDNRFTALCERNAIKLYQILLELRRFENCKFSQIIFPQSVGPDKSNSIFVNIFRLFFLHLLVFRGTQEKKVFRAFPFR